MEDLQMGASILKEYITLETEKQDRAARAKKSEKAAHDAAAERVIDTLSFQHPMAVLTMHVWCR